MRGNACCMWLAIKDFRVITPCACWQLFTDCVGIGKCGMRATGCFALCRLLTGMREVSASQPPLTSSPQLQRVAAQELSPANFHEQYWKRNVPVVITGERLRLRLFCSRLAITSASSCSSAVCLQHSLTFRIDGRCNQAATAGSGCSVGSERHGGPCEIELCWSSAKEPSRGFCSSASASRHRAGALAEWPACDKWRRLSWWCRQHGHRSVPVEIGVEGTTGWREDTLRLHEFMVQHMAPSLQQENGLQPAYIAQVAQLYLSHALGSRRQQHIVHSPGCSSGSD